MMRKVLRTLIILFLLYYIYEFIFVYFQGGHNINYVVFDGEKEFKINEVAVSGLKNDKDNYYLKIDVDDNISFSFQTFENFGRISNIVKNVKYYSDDKYNCIFVKYNKEKILNDVLCKSNNGMQYYNTIKNPSDNLKKFVSSLEEYGYKKDQWKDKAKSKDYYNSSLYVDNLLENHYIGVSHEKGFYRINSIDKMALINAFLGEYDIKDIKVRDFVSNKFFILDYQLISKSTVFYSKNVTDKSSSYFKTDVLLSPDTYVLGSRNESVYIYDPSSKIEYEVDLSNSSMLEVGNKETGILYYNGNEMKRSKIEDIDKIKFSNLAISDYENENFERIDKIGNKYGFYYLYEKNGSAYKVYRADINHKDDMIYLFTTTNLNKIVYVDDFIYYVNGSKLLYYSDMTGNKVVLDGLNLIEDDNSLIYAYIKNKD